MSKKTSKTCPNCAKAFSFYASAGDKLYCSKECYQSSRRADTNCPECGKEFWYHKSWPRKYCCQSCAGKNALKNFASHFAGETLNVKCDWCGNKFNRNAFEIAKTQKHFCSRACFGAWLSKTQKGIPRPEVRGENPKRHKRTDKTCPQCQGVFRVKNSHAARRKFCSKACMAEWQKIAMAGENGFNWRGGYEPYYGPNWRTQRRNARRRDKYTCQHCGKTEQKLKRQLDVHHIKPFRLFGKRHKEANRLSNLVSLCNRCHLKEEHTQGQRPNPLTR